jgi:hypothetical protein
MDLYWHSLPTSLWCREGQLYLTLNRGWKQWKISLRWHSSVYCHQNKFIMLYASGSAWGPVIIMLCECDYVQLNSVHVLIFSLAERLVASQEGLCCTGVVIFCCAHICKFLKVGFMTNFDCLIFVPRRHDLFILMTVTVRLSRVCNKLYTFTSYGVFMAGVAHITVLWDFALCMFCCVFRTYL